MVCMLEKGGTMEVVLGLVVRGVSLLGGGGWRVIFSVPKEDAGWLFRR